MNLLKKAFLFFFFSLGQQNILVSMALETIKPETLSNFRSGISTAQPFIIGAGVSLFASYGISKLYEKQDRKTADSIMMSSGALTLALGGIYECARARLAKTVKQGFGDHVTNKNLPSSAPFAIGAATTFATLALYSWHQTHRSNR